MPEADKANPEPLGMDIVDVVKTGLVPIDEASRNVPPLVRSVRKPVVGNVDEVAPDIKAELAELPLFMVSRFSVKVPPPANTKFDVKLLMNSILTTLAPLRRLRFAVPVASKSLPKRKRLVPLDATRVVPVRTFKVPFTVTVRAADAAKLTVPVLMVNSFVENEASIFMVVPTKTRLSNAKLPVPRIVGVVETEVIIAVRPEAIVRFPAD